MTATTARVTPADEAAPDVSLVVTLLGLGASLMAVSQVWRLLDVRRLWWLQPLDAILANGRVGATMLAVCVGFLCGLSFLARHPREVPSRLRVALGPVCMTWVLTAVAVAAVLCSAALDDRHPSDPEDVSRLARPILGLYWNLWIIENPLGAPSSLSGLWIISALVQLWLAGAVVFVLLARWPRVIVAILLMMAAYAGWWRTSLVLDGAWFEASLHTLGLADGFCVGALAALVVGVVDTRGSTWAAGLFSAAMLAWGGVLIGSAFFTNDGLVVGVAPIAGILTAIACLGSGCGPDRSMLATSFLGRARVVNVARAWPLVVLWSQIVIVEVQIRTADVDQWLRVLVAATMLLIAVTLTRSLIVAPLSFLAAHLGLRSSSRDDHRRTLV